MSISLSTLCSPTPISLNPFKSPQQTRLLTSHRTKLVPLHSSLKPHIGFKRINVFSGKLSIDKKLGFAIKAENGDKGVVVEQGENEARGMSTMPERFRYLTQEAPDPPVRWPYFIGIISSCLHLLCRVLVLMFYCCYCIAGLYGSNILGVCLV